jgi:lysophospholipase L1-like esterase
MRASDRGQVSASYLGMLVLVGSIVVAVLAVGVPADIGGGLEEAICRITSLGDSSSCDSGSSEEAEGSERAPTPRERAEAGDYVAIGDSFSSGEGAYDYDPATDTDENRCHRSANAYSEHIARDHDFHGSVRVVTCSGAKARNVLETGQNGEPAQIEAVTENTSLVTVGISGNDADWVPVIQNCLIHDADGCQSDEAAVRARIQEAADRAFDVYLQARARAGDDARVVAVGYPRFFPTEPTDDLFQLNLGCVSVPFAGTHCAKRFSISRAEQEYMNGLTRDFNDLLAQKAAEAGVEFVDMTDAFDGHEFGTDDPFFNSVVLDWPDCAPTNLDCIKSVIQAETSHPNAKGQERMGELVDDQVDHP